MVSVTLDLRDEAATGWLAARIAAETRARDVIALKGPLGSGKTSFARAFIRALGRGDEEVPSPTFTLVETYSFPRHPTIWHFDLYRLEAPEDAYELGIEEAWADGICLIEWPERLAGLMPPERLEIALAQGVAPESRIATLHAMRRWAPTVERMGHA